jgi:FKBP-type peptidyl-prolyl cis-trans isomerase SlyD
VRIKRNTMVTLIYELRENTFEGKIIEAADEENPLTFLYGSGKMLPFFESNILSLDKGDHFRFTIASEHAYGDKREEMIVNVPISVFEVDGKLDEEICRVGNEVPMVDVSGNPLHGVIIEISDTCVKMDFNHPVAGVDLFFSGRIIDTRYPEAGEISACSNSCSGCGNHGHITCSGSGQ